MGAGTAVSATSRSNDFTSFGSGVPVSVDRVPCVSWDDTVQRVPGRPVVVPVGMTSLEVILYPTPPSLETLKPSEPPLLRTSENKSVGVRLRAGRFGSFPWGPVVGSGVGAGSRGPCDSVSVPGPTSSDPGYVEVPSLYTVPKDRATRGVLSVSFERLVGSEGPLWRLVPCTGPRWVSG